MKHFVYFFKQNNVDAIKIASVCSESIIDRFELFKSYSPYGAEIVGFYECENSIEEIKEIHKKYSDKKLNNDFFAISYEQALLECLIRNTKLEEAQSMVIGLISKGISANTIKKAIEKYDYIMQVEKVDKPIHEIVLDKMPKFFTTKQFVNAAYEHKMMNSTAKMYLRRLLGLKVSKSAHGQYMKIIE